MLRGIFFVGWQDVRFQLRDRSTLLWLLIMPPVFFFFIGTVIGGFGSGIGGGQTTPLTVVAEDPGFVREQIDLRLVDNDFAPEWIESLDIRDDAPSPTRTLTFDAGMSNRLMARMTSERRWTMGIRSSRVTS